MQKVYAKKHMIIFQRAESGEYVVYNTNKPWEDGHTHIHTLKQAKYLVDCILNNKIPQKVNSYFLVSLIRLSNDKKYTQQVEYRLENMQKRKLYYNTPKGFRR